MTILLKYKKTIGWALFIFVISTIRISTPYAISGVAHLDKLVHFFTYFVLSIFFCLEAKKDLKRIFLLIIPILFGGAIELVQMFLTSSRSGDWFDWAADAVGSIAGFILIVIYLNLKKK